MPSCAREVLARVGFPLGVKASASATTVPPGAVWFARNVRARDTGILKTRPGTSVVTEFSGSGRVRMLRNLGPDQLLMAYNTNMYLGEPGSDFSVIESAWTTEDMADRFASVHWQDETTPQVYMFTGDGLYEADATGVTACTPLVPEVGDPSNLLAKESDPSSVDPDSPICKSTIAAMKFGMQMRAACAYNNRVYLSAPSALTYWPVNQVIYLPDDGDDIVALAVWFDILVIFRRHDVWAFLGTDVGDTTAKLVRQAQVGCVARDTVVDVPGVGMFFLGADNVYALTGVQAISDRMQPVPIGNDIQPVLRLALANGGEVDACAVYHDSEYILSLGAFGGGDKIFVYQTAPTTAWFIDSAPVVSYWAPLLGSLYSMRAEPTGLRHHSYDYATDNGQSIPVEIHFGQEMLPTYAKIRRLFIILQGQETIQHLRVSVAVDTLALEVKEFAVTAPFGRDFAIGEGAIELDRIGRVTELRTYEARVSMKGQYIQLVMSGNEVGERLGIAGYIVEYIPRAMMRGLRSGVVQTWPT